MKRLIDISIRIKTRVPDFKFLVLSYKLWTLYFEQKTKIKNKNMFYNTYLNFETTFFEANFNVVPEQNSSI